MIFIKLSQLYWSLLPQLKLFVNDTASLWFDTGFIGESRDIMDYLGFMIWLIIPILSIYLLYKLIKTII